MAAKRLAPDQEHDDDTHPKGKKLRPAPSFASVIGEVMMVKSSLQGSFCNLLEPLLRRVVSEEVERGLEKNIRSITKSPSLRIQAPEPATLSLIFSYTNLPTTFTCSKILDVNGESLKVMLVEKSGDQITPKILPYPLKIEIVAIHGDFPGSSDRDVWTSDEFNRGIVKEREGRRPLLTKEVIYVIRNTNYVTVGELEFTDNSSWLRSRRFKLGARVIGESSQGVRVLEALTEAFIVKDHRGELYKKHYPPMLEDDVWRLEKIGKDGKFHKRLKQAGIHTVQDFLKFSVINSIKLKSIIGGKTGISEKMWETVLKHAKMCDIGNKIYISHGTNYTIFLDAICQILTIKINGQLHSAQELTTSVKQQIDELVKNAHENWNALQVVDRSIDEILFQDSTGTMVTECNNEEMIPYEIVFGGVIELSGSQVNNNLEENTIGDWGPSTQMFD